VCYNQNDKKLKLYIEITFIILRLQLVIHMFPAATTAPFARNVVRGAPWDFGHFPSSFKFCYVLLSFLTVSSPAGRGRSRSNRGRWASCSLHPAGAWAYSGIIVPGLTQSSILSWSVNQYRLRLRLRRFKAGTCSPMCDAAWCAPCT